MTGLDSGDLLPIGVLARRAGLSVPTIRYYEQRGLISAQRTTGNQRRYPRHTLRRLAIIAAGSRVGLSLQQIDHTLAVLPIDCPPTQDQWRQMSRSWALLIDERIRQLKALQTDLTGCIGCGCLSLTRCSLFNPGDTAAAEGPGSRWIRSAMP